jgi:S-adenosylmethionine/arginine decarboxylase-like enzyme
VEQLYSTEGRHIIVDVHEADRAPTLEDAIHAAEMAGMTIVHAEEIVNSIVVILAESHLTIHQRNGRWFMDIYTCGPKDPSVAMQYLLDIMQATKYYETHLLRGTQSLVKGDEFCEVIR